MAANAYEQYLESRVLNSDPIELVRLLYGGALQAIRDARRHLQAGDIASRTREVNRAAAIVTELTVSLDHEAGRELSRSLAELYDYVQRCLLQANFDQSDPPLADAAKVLETLLEGWQACRPEAADTGSPQGIFRPAPEAGQTSHAWSL
jgi:flagellar protein FliS